MEQELQSSSLEVAMEVQEHEDQAETGKSDNMQKDPEDSNDVIAESAGEHKTTEEENFGENGDSDNVGDVMPVDENSAPATAGKEGKPNGLPLARIRALINTAQEVGIVSKAAVILIAKATEMFIAQLASDAARHLSSTKRKTIQLNDIAAIINMCDEYAFLDGISLVESNKQPKSSNNPNASTTSPLGENNGPSNLEEIVAE